MKLKFVVALLGLLTLTAAVAEAAGPLDIEAALGTHNKFVWRGQTLTDDAVLQPALNLDVIGMYFGVWGNMDLTDANEQKYDFSRLDWTIGYGLSLPLISLDFGFVYYDLPESGPTLENIFSDTAELYLKGEAHVLLSPRLAVYKDVDKYKGAYWTGGITYGSKLGESVGLDLAVDLGYGSQGYVGGYFGFATTTPASAGLTDLLLSLQAPWHAVPMLTITPHVSWATLLGDVKTAYDEDGRSADSVFYGLTATFSF